MSQLHDVALISYIWFIEPFLIMGCPVCVKHHGNLCHTEQTLWGHFNPFFFCCCEVFLFLSSQRGSVCGAWFEIHFCNKEKMLLQLCWMLMLSCGKFSSNRIKHELTWPDTRMHIWFQDYLHLDSTKFLLHMNLVSILDINIDSHSFLHLCKQRSSLTNCSVA